jgi:hypothetical protein
MGNSNKKKLQAITDGTADTNSTIFAENLNKLLGAPVRDYICKRDERKCQCAPRTPSASC